MSKTVGLVSFHTGFNYGTMLQCYAMNKLIEEVGYTPVMLWHRPGLIKGRDITIKKLFTIAIRLVLHPMSYKKTVGAYVKAFSQEMSDETKKQFLDFIDNEIDIHCYSDSQLKRIAKSDEMNAVVCGSDQIWKADLLYLSPYYYLRFVPTYKKIAYAPSFGMEQVAPYNKKKIAKYVNDFAYLSSRETNGQRIIKELTNKDATLVLDPTLAIDKSEYENITIENENIKDYIILYFLNDINPKYRKQIKDFILNKGYKVIYFPYEFDFYNEFDNAINVDCGPKEFLGYIKNAKFIFTDSYHGMLFSIINEVNFYCIERDYGGASKQNSRIETIINSLELEDRYITDGKELTDEIIDYTKTNILLNELKITSKAYLKNSIEKVK